MLKRGNIDRQQLEAVVAEYQDRLFRFAFFRVGSPDDASDIVQDVFVKMFTRGYVHKEVGSLKSYLFRSVSNACVDLLRKRGKHRHTQIDDVVIRTETPDQYEDARAEYQRITRLMADLPDEQAEVIRMKTIGGLSFVEIAEVTRVPVTTVKSRFKYGIDKIRNKITSSNS